MAVPVIKSSDISIIFQGPLLDEAGFNGWGTARSINTARKIFPNSQIILSTWNGTAIGTADADQIVYSDPPSAIPFQISGTKLNNINRMLISCQAGVRMADRPYVLKLRTDATIWSRRLVDEWARIASIPRIKPLFKKQVAAYPIYSLLFEGRWDQRKMPKPFHVSDWAFFGLNDDIQEIYGAELVEEPNYSRFFEQFKDERFDTLPDVMWRYSPEQYLFLSALRRKRSDVPRFDHKRDYDKYNIKYSNKAIFDNFIFPSLRDWDLSHSKNEYNKPIFMYDDNCYFGLIKTSQSVRHQIISRKRWIPIKYFMELSNSIKEDWIHSKIEAPNFSVSTFWFFLKKLIISRNTA